MKWSPLPIVTPVVLLALAIPLAAFAAFTTTVAFGTLLIRFSIVYFELGLALIRSYVFAPAPPSHATNRRKDAPAPPTSSSSSPHSPRVASPPRRRKSSIVSNASSQDLTMTTTTTTTTTTGRPAGRSQSVASLVGYSSDANRDFEGVGGWRLPGEAAEEALWIGMNSRLELPAAVGDRQRKNHVRSLTAGSMQRWSWSPEAMRMSPVQSRARTPNETLHALEGYFALQPQTRTAGAFAGMAFTPDIKRKSGPSSSASSTSTSSAARTPKKATKQGGH